MMEYKIYLYTGFAKTLSMPILRAAWVVSRGRNKRRDDGSHPVAVAYIYGRRRSFKFHSIL